MKGLEYTVEPPNTGHTGHNNNYYYASIVSFVERLSSFRGSNVLKRYYNNLLDVIQCISFVKVSINFE